MNLRYHKWGPNRLFFSEDVLTRQKPQLDRIRELMRAYIWCYRASGMMPSSMFFTAPVLFLLWHIKMSAVRAVLGIRLSVFHKEWFHWITLHLITLQECGSCKQELALLDCWGKKNTNRLMTLYTSFCCQWQIGRLDVIEKVGFQSDIK